MAVIDLPGPVVFVGGKGSGQRNRKGAPKVNIKPVVIDMNTKSFTDKSGRDRVQNPFDLDGA